MVEESIHRENNITSGTTVSLVEWWILWEYALCVQSTVTRDMMLATGTVLSEDRRRWKDITVNWDHSSVIVERRAVLL